MTAALLFCDEEEAEIPAAPLVVKESRVRRESPHFEIPKADDELEAYKIKLKKFFEKSDISTKVIEALTEAFSEAGTEERGAMLAKLSTRPPEAPQPAKFSREEGDVGAIVNRLLESSPIGQWVQDQRQVNGDPTNSRELVDSRQTSNPSMPVIFVHCDMTPMADSLRYLADQLVKMANVKGGSGGPRTIRVDHDDGTHSILTEGG